MKLLFIPFFCLSLLALAGDSQELIGIASQWHYIDAGKAAPTDWQIAKLDEKVWKKGASPMGYGEPRMNTELSYGDDPRKKAMTYYFRHDFKLETLPPKLELFLSFRVDDGAIFYLNGKEVHRYNLAKDAKVNDPAIKTIGGYHEKQYHDITLKVSKALRKGVNHFAVRLHQAEPLSSDVIFDLELLIPAKE